MKLSAEPGFLESLDVHNKLFQIANSNNSYEEPLVDIAMIDVGGCSAMRFSSRSNKRHAWVTVSLENKDKVLIFGTDDDLLLDHSGFAPNMATCYFCTWLDAGAAAQMVKHYLKKGFLPESALQGNY